jgi:hypothetical protein
MKNFLKFHWFKLSILVILLAIGGLMTWYFAFKVPSMEGAKQKAILIQEENRQRIVDQEKADKKLANNLQALRLSSCLSGAVTDYSNNWDNDCTLIGETPNCSLSASQATRWDEWLKDAKNDCYKLFQ